MAEPTYKRSRKLINPLLQLRLVTAFGGVAVLAMLLQFLILGFQLTRAASSVEGHGGQLAAVVPGVLIGVLGMSLIVLVPIFLGLGVLLTFRLAGPVYRFEQHLNAIARGENPGPCRIRKGDELQSLCDAINSATDALRARPGYIAPSADPDGQRPAA